LDDTLPNETAFRFGPDSELFGVFHAPDGAARRTVVFCAPFAEEKKCSYRAFCRAARRFADAGTAVLRFDYFGTGDSGGDFREFAPHRAVEDITAASAKAQELAGGAPVTLLGLRLGGAFALAAAGPADSESIVLWQPVLDTGRYLDLAARRQIMRRQIIGGGASGSEDEGVIDLDGFPLAASAADEIRSLSPAAAARQFGGPVHVLQISHADGVSREMGEFADTLGERGSAAAVVCEPFWNRIDAADVTGVIEATLGLIS
jgi:pimeloyl-ACP methyl ester carboxylesterase